MVSFEQFQNSVYLEYPMYRDEQREGQHAFNVLSKTRKDIADKIHGTEFDPFYDDSVIDVFWQAVQEHW